MQYAPSSPPSSKKAPGDADPFDKSPPYNLDAEQGVLGSLLVWNDAQQDIPFVGAEDFFDGLHRAIFEAIAASVKAGRRANPITLAPQFASAEPVAADMTVPQYLVRLTTLAVPRPHLKDHARVIADLAARRQMMLIGEDLAQAARESAVDVAPSALIEEAETRLFALAQHTSAEISTTQSFGEAADAFVAGAFAVAEGKIVGIRTGLSDLDAKLVGPDATDLIILAGRPSMGKTALATNIAFHVAHTQMPVDFYSLEMGSEQLAGRVLAEQVGVSASKYRSGKASPDELRRLLAKKHDLADVPLNIDHTGGISIAQLTARARRMKRKRNTGLIVIDYIQLMRPSQGRRSGSRVEDVSEITAGLKALAKELKVPIIALSQLNRAVEGRDSKRPQLADLRDSGSIEQDADTVLFCFREEYYLERLEPSITDHDAYSDWQQKMHKASGKAEIIIGKQRHGELGIIQCAFSGEFTRFSDLARNETRGHP